MSTISSTAERRADAGGHVLAKAAGAAKRLWEAYLTWHVERAAIILLRSMSDRELSDLGLARSEIADVVGGGAANARRRNLQAD